MTDRFQDVTATELAVLEVLWEVGSATIRHITDVLYPNGTNSDYATVQKLLSRLETKGCVGRDRSGPVHIFQAVIQRETLVGKRLQAVAESLCEGSIAPLLTHLVHALRLNKSDRQMLRSLIDNLDNDAKPRRGAGKSTRRK